MEKTQHLCKECKFHSYDVFARGKCLHPDVSCLIEPYCPACFRFKEKRQEEMRYKCKHCGRTFISRCAHCCNTGFRKRNLEWIEYEQE